MLKDDLSTTDRLTLLAGDSDAFGRWDAGQALMLDTVRAMANDAPERDSLIESLGKGWRRCLLMIALMVPKRPDPQIAVAVDHGRDDGSARPAGDFRYPPEDAA